MPDEKREQVLVDKKAFIELIGACLGPYYLVRELQTIASFPDTPLNILINDFNRINQEKK